MLSLVKANASNDKIRHCRIAVAESCPRLLSDGW